MTRISARNNTTGQIITGTPSAISVQTNLRGWTDWDIIEITAPTAPLSETIRSTTTNVRAGQRSGEVVRTRAADRRRQVIRMLEDGATVDEIHGAVGVGAETIRAIKREMLDRRAVA